ITPKLDINNFKELRDNYNIPVTTLSIENDDVEWIQKRVQTHLQEVQQSNTDTRWIEYGYYLLFPIVILMLLWFRKGWSVRWIVMLIIYISFFNTSSYAYENEVVSDSIKSSVDSTDITDVNKYKWEWFFNLWMTRDQQGRYYFERNDFPKAAERFENNLWKGISLYYAKNYDDAINQFAMLEDAQSHFYLGNSYARLENYELAKTSYEEAIRLEKDFPEAEYNLKIVLAILKKIEEEKKKDEEEEAQDPNQSPDEIKFDEKGKKGKKGKVEELKLTPEKMADIWMRNIQVSPADFLRRKFHIQSEKK
ncbi:MAG: tetratricopeptide repeat protein, partial [Bacteroidota bacterium]